MRLACGEPGIAYSWAIPGSPQANLIFGGNAFPLSAWWFYAFLFVGLMVAAGARVPPCPPAFCPPGRYPAIVARRLRPVIPGLPHHPPQPIKLAQRPQG